MRKLVLVLLMSVAPAFAQQPDPIGVVAHVLELSPDQITAWSGILHARQTAIEPLAQQVQAHEQAIGQALGGGSPDPTAVGGLFIELHALQMQVAGVNSESAAKFEQLLTPEQAQRLHDLRAAAQVCPIVPAFQMTGLL